MGTTPRCAHQNDVPGRLYGRRAVTCWCARKARRYGRILKALYSAMATSPWCWMHGRIPMKIGDVALHIGERITLADVITIVSQGPRCEVPDLSATHR